VPEPMIAPSFAPLVAAFADCFTAPTFATFRHVVAGWILCVGRHTVTGVLRASGAVGVKHHTSFHRFFRSAAWIPDQLGLCLLKMVLALVPKDEVVIVPVDDTLGRHTGKAIRAAAMHHDPLLSTRTKPVFHWGHVWVVLCIVVRVPVWKKSFALPVLARLYRSKKLCTREKRTFLKKTELAAQMIAIMARAAANRRFCVVGDNAYANRSIVKPLPDNVDFIGRARLDAALYAPPKALRSGRGRPRVKGARLPSPADRAGSPRGWRRLSLDVYGRSVTVQVKLFDALWYKVAGGRCMRFLVVRGWPGHQHDDVLCSTDLSLDAQEIAQRFCLRWLIEVTFQETKGKLGFEDPQNRTERAVERTAPMALWVYTLTVVWYLGLDRRLKSARLPEFPWYQKTVPAFSDMLAALRREAWRHQLLDPQSPPRRDQKSIEPLLDAIAYAA
jgi:hypothetical protein